MASLVPQCRGFTHPLVLLVRSTLRPGRSLEPSARITTCSPSLFLTGPSRSQRCLSLSRVLFKAANTADTKKKTPPTTNKPPAADSLASRMKRIPPLSYAQQLALRATPTILYETAPQTGFLFSSYGAAFFCMGSAAINSWLNVFNLPPGISPWVSTGFGVISFLFATLGTIFALRPSYMIHSIKLLPFSSSQRQGVGPLPSGVTLEVAARHPAPFPLPLKRFQVKPEQIVLVTRLLNRPVVLSEQQRIAKQQEDTRRRKEAREYELNHLMTAPFRDAGRASSTLFGNIRRGLTGEGFSPIFINGVQYKLDSNGSYAHEGGLALDRLVKIEPDPELARSRSKIE
ncbi:hypothetical protein F5B22DRAFT_149558 [Xylaria bambusicola]|uniref:uncharacterized protein n=1 Tax=Xylaria bambusicola TaxID=326684 RepID=UPI002008CCEF|nr:uncharacterized protein F5B22DRAFT_149558 [Xylaria bambusicola]KAI0526250.1 hypothetical protein F5B22DRAFT_149558 [Xylaria bambusicola]